MQRESKIFHLGDILSVTTSLLVSPRYMDGVYELIRYLTATEPQLDAIQDAMALCRPYLLLQHPDLAEIDTVDIDFENWRGWLDDQTQRYGEWLTVERPLPGEIGPG